MSRYTNPTPQIPDGGGKPIVGAKKFFFTVGTELKKTVYSDSAFTTAIANPVLSDADGRFPPIFLNGLYDEVQQDNSGTATGYDGVTLWGPLLVGTTAEGPFESWGSDNTYNIPNIVLGSNDEYYRSLIDSNTGNDPISSPGSWEQLQFGRVWNTNITYSEGDTVYGSDGFLYISIVDTNLANNPVSSSANWRPATNQNQSAIAAGTVDAITAVMPIPLQALNDETMVTIRASGANTSTTPTFSPDGLAAKTITKNGNQALSVGDIYGAGHELQLKYNSTNDKWELLNPTIKKFNGALVYMSADYTLATATIYRMEFDSEDYDTSSIHDNVTNNTRLTVPSGVTKIRLSGQIQYTGGTTGYRRLLFLKNNGAFIGGGDNITPAGTPFSLGVLNVVSSIVTVTSGDYFEMQAYQTSGANADLESTNSWFAMEIIE